MKLLSFIFLLTFPFAASAQSPTLAWNRHITHTNLSEYTLRWGITQGVYTDSRSVATNITAVQVFGLTPGQQYYFVVTARNVAGLDSDPSNEVGYRVPGGTGPTAVPGAPQQFAINKVP